MKRGACNVYFYYFYSRWPGSSEMGNLKFMTRYDFVLYFLLILPHKRPVIIKHVIKAFKARRRFIFTLPPAAAEQFQLQPPSGRLRRR